jgi:uncharacterized protein (DUF934 family)
MDNNAPDTNIATLSEFAASNATAVRIEPGEDARLLIPYLDRITLAVITFPAFRDGRGYSSARMLREAGYTGEMQAAGDVLVDQLAFMSRCGFTSFAPNAPLDPIATERALTTYKDVYQSAADAQIPVWKLRHG